MLLLYYRSSMPLLFVPNDDYRSLSGKAFFAATRLFRIIVDHQPLADISRSASGPVMSPSARAFLRHQRSLNLTGQRTYQPLISESGSGVLFGGHYDRLHSVALKPLRADMDSFVPSISGIAKSGTMTGTLPKYSAASQLS